MQQRLVSPLIFVILSLLWPLHTAEAARRVIRKKMERPSPWFGSADLSYSNWLKDKLEGGGETRVGGLQLGLNLPYSMSIFVRASAMPEPEGFQDLRAGWSKGMELSPAFRNTVSSSLSVPTSAYSRSLRQKTQASLATTLEYYHHALIVSFTAYGAKAYYEDDGTITTTAASLQLKRKDLPKNKKPRPPAGAPLTPIAADVTELADSLPLDYTDTFYLTRFDYLSGGALDFTWRFNSEWAVNSAGSLTRTTFNTEETLWTMDMTLLQLNYAWRSLSIFASTGLLDSAPGIHMQRARTYTLGSSYILLN